MAIPVKTYITQGSATPFPHILYSAVSECGWLNHLTICFRVLGRLFLLINCRCVSHTFSQKLISSSDGLSSLKLSHHPSGKPCNLPHSVGVSLLTIKSSTFTSGGSLSSVATSVLASSFSALVKCEFLLDE